MKIKSRKIRSHWLDCSEEKYGKILVLETKAILSILVLYLPIPLYWALYYQQGSRWIFQAVKMNGDLGVYIIKPDQLNILNPLLVFILIPLFEYILYPLLSNVRIKTPLQKATLGGVLAAVSFVISAVVESQIDDKYLHMSWLIPQYLVMAMSEILIAIPMMNFAYSEAPHSMKTIVQAFGFLSIGLGNLIVVIVAGSKLIDSQVYEFILFAALMFIDIIVFGFLVSRYKSLNLNGGDKRDNSK